MMRLEMYASYLFLLINALELFSIPKTFEHGNIFKDERTIIHILLTTYIHIQQPM